MKTPILGNNVDICTVEYGRETSVASLFGCCARRTSGLREPEKAGCSVPTESDEPTPREERYRGGGTNDVYGFVFWDTQHYMKRGVSVVL